MSRRKPNVTEDSHCLTPRQIEILTMVRDGRRRNGYSPTLQEIADDYPVELVSPIDTQFVQYNDATFTWKPVPDASLYHLNSKEL